MDYSALNQTGTPFEMRIETGKVREFARAVHAEDQPAYMTTDAPVIPPTFLTSQFFWEERVPDSNPWHRVLLDPQRGMHAEQEYIFHGPPPKAGTRLTCTSRIAEMYEKEGKRGGKLGFAVMVTEFRDESGRLVAEARMTGVETARPPEEGR